MAIEPKLSSSTGVTPDEERLTQEQRPARPRTEIVSPDPASVANDDRDVVEMLTASLRAKPSPTPYILAFLASLLWLGGLGALAWWRAEGQTSRLISSR